MSRLKLETLQETTRKFLNVGGNNKTIPVPQQYEGWEHHLLDIDEKAKPDILCDARNLTSLPGGEYDAVYCSHNLEHYFRHEVPKVLAGFHHVLKDDGFVQIRVPDLEAVMKEMIEKKIDIEDVLYQSPAGPITPLDVIYGHHRIVAKTGNDYFAHKTGFTKNSLSRILVQAGFVNGNVICNNLEVVAVVFKNKPTKYHEELFSKPCT